MQIGVYEIRRIGNIKILQHFQHDNDFWDDLRVQNLKFSDVKCSAFSFPKVYNEVQSYDGMVAFMETIEPLMSCIDEPDKSLQRKFRNQWDTLWRSFFKDTGVVPEDWIKELGIRLAFYSDCAPQEILDFYNAVLHWYVASMSESSCTALGLKSVDLIEMLATLDGGEFIAALHSNFSQCGKVTV